MLAQRSADTHLTSDCSITAIATFSISFASSILRCLSRSLRCCAFSCLVLPAACAGGSVGCAPLADSAEGGGDACTVLQT